MKDEYLRHLEESAEVKRILKTSKALYNRDKASQIPPSFDALMQRVKKQERKKRKLEVSPWWLAAACQVGILIGWAIPSWNSSSEMHLAVNDTVVVAERHTDTIYQQVVPMQSSVKRRTNRGMNPTHLAMQPEIILTVMADETPLIDPDNVEQVSNGKSLAQDDFPIHLLVSR